MSKLSSMVIVFPKVVSLLTWISYFHPLTASSVIIFVNDIVSPSLKNLWQASLLVSIPKIRVQYIAIYFQFMLQNIWKCSTKYEIKMLSILPSLQSLVAASNKISSSPLGKTGTTHRGRFIISSNFVNS